MKIKEIIVVEGKDDTTAIKRAVDADTIETNGSSIGDSVIEQVKLAQKTRGVILFTDPDFPGEKIRNTIAEKVPGCKHAFLPKEEARPKRGKGIGVEHASVEAIRNALQAVKEEMEEFTTDISLDDLLEAGLLGGERARARREELGLLLKIGYTNGKQLLKRLQMFQISRDEYVQAINKILQEEKNG
ncbi:MULTISPECIES: ribonuclease M5 [Metabacillus]|uniref:Ribonuclease M5 n=1 Tax=Metabacillus rhizolycopersici TaxID=2875709 RepID=A0ABS7UT22_9BACI|nr:MULTISPECIES: ribonuclease M5 [Metabacillus]MBZ5751158.1 ribonuclease M5 [Metabacillus rhizolycopersici]MCM3655025.1 ribonuclease M5 [Metabacillus litoralis]